MQEAVLKGFSDGYKIILNQSGNFDVAMTELESLLERLKLEEQKKLVGEKNDEATAQVFDVNTENRLLNEGQQRAITELFNRYTQFELGKIEAGVLTQEDAVAWKERESVHTLTQTIRSGQDMTITGDVLFLGKLHRGAVLKATGSIFILGEVEGIVHAGFGSNDECVIAGNFQQATQLRINDSFEIMENLTFEFKESVYFAYINDLHLMDFALLETLKTVKPKIYNKLGGF